MTSLTTGVDAALAADRALVTMLIEVTLPSGPLRLMAGSGAIAWGEKTFSDVDAIFGTLASIDVIEDGAGDDAPTFSFSMYPPSNSSAAQLCSPTFQGSPLNVWLAALNPITGILIPDPDLLFTGQLDVPTLSIDKGAREVDFACVSDFELLLEDDEGARLSDAFHQSIWPGETGFSNVTGVERDIYWGLATPPGGSVVINTTPTYGTIISKTDFGEPRVY